MPGRKYEAQSGYRYGFNGKEKDKDLNSLTAYDYGFRIYNPGIGKFLSVDPLTQSYPWYTPYQFAGNSPIANIDLDGAEPKPATDGTQEGQRQTITETKYAPSDCNCSEAEGYQVSKTWYWHTGSKDYNTTAGWYESEDYAKTLNPIAKDLAGYQQKYNGVPRAGHNWSDAEKSNVANTPLGKFIMAGLTEDGEKHLSAMAQFHASQANFNTTGTVYSSGFNVEDILGVGLILKQGFKALGSITMKGLGKTSGTVWDDILATQSNYPGSILPKSFELTTPNGAKVWVHGNATEHIAEFIKMKAINATPGSVKLATQLQLSSLQSAVNTATKNGVIYNQIMNVGGWELKFAMPKAAGQLPALIHAMPK